MSIANRPSKITLPSENKGWQNLLEFLVEQFPHIDVNIWQSRFNEGKIHWLSGDLVSSDTAFVANKTLCYYREVEKEPQIPFQHNILFKNDHILVACKPHFLPVTPGGQYVKECLLERLRTEQNLPEIVPLHRLDKDTAGVVLFSLNPESRGLYAQLFAKGKMSKCYNAVADLSDHNESVVVGQKWIVENRLVKSNPAFLMHEVEGEINARSEITLLDYKQDLGLFQLNPVTGKTHQLRLHMTKIGAPIANDPFYPILQPKAETNYKNPLQLLAKSLSFTDPISGEHFEFSSDRKLAKWKTNEANH